MPDNGMLTSAEAWSYLHRHARKHGYDVSDNQWYSLDLLEILADSVISGHLPATQGDGRSAGDPAEGGNIQAMLADVSRGLYGRDMDPSQRAVLLLHFQGYIEASRVSLNLALVALQDTLGGARP